MSYTLKSNFIKNTNLIRLNKIIASSGYCSRRKADVLISKGLVTVNRKVTTDLGIKINDNAEIIINGKKLKRQNFVYILLNKPINVITTNYDPQNRRKVIDLIDLKNIRVFPVGRLDRNTTGVLLLTNDGKLTNFLTHPSNNITKIYKVTLDKKFNESDISKLQKGINLEDGITKIDKIFVFPKFKNIIQLEIHSGKNRIVRRLLEHLEYNVLELDRISFAGIKYGTLKTSQSRLLNSKELSLLKKQQKR
ncbi:MAG: pseudouridine synthase [Bacteroidota bacterium]|nr:pseudouridine synthase [Bacteroidota bacterium]